MVMALPWAVSGRGEGRCSFHCPSCFTFDFVMIYALSVQNIQYIPKAYLAKMNCPLAIRNKKRSYKVY